MKHSLLLLGLSSLLATGSASAALYNYTSGHGDIGLGEGSELELHLHVHDGTEDGAEYAPDEAIIVVPQSTWDYKANNGGRTAGPEWDALGVAAGESYWFLPQDATEATNLGAPFLGVGAEEITLGAFDDNLFTLTLTGASTPDGGDFSVWTTNAFNEPTFYMSTADGVSAADALTLDLDDGGHAHYSFGFTQAGTYDITFTVSAMQGGELMSDTATYTFEVVPEPSTYAALAGAAALGLVLLRRRLAKK